MIMSTNKLYTLNQILYSRDGVMVCCWLVKWPKKSAVSCWLNIIVEMSIGILLLVIAVPFYWGFVKLCMLFIYYICHCSPPLTEIHSIHFFRFWLLPNLGSCTAIAFHPTKRNELLIATVNSSINLMNIGRLGMGFRLLLQWFWRVLFSGICPHVV
jgi:hypothetical protein